MTEAVRPPESTPPEKAPVSPPPADPRPGSGRGRREDNEFLAPALEILETPPSPVRIAFIWIISAFVVVAIAWAYIGHVDIIAVAQGKFEPTGRVKVIEPVETSKVEAIHVVNGDSVKAGDVLVELDRSSAEADRRAASEGLASARAENIRRRAALDAAKARHFDTIDPIQWPDNVPEALRRREERVLSADIGALAATLASYQAQLVQKTAERDKLIETIATQKNLVSTLQQRVDMRTTLMQTKSEAKSAVIDATETLQYQITQLAMQEGQLASATPGLDVIQREADKTIETFASDNAQKLDESERQVEDLAQRVAKADAAIDHLTLRSPIDGHIQASVITNVGQVVQSGQEIMRVVPENSAMEIEAYVLNRDIGFIQIGQEAVVKVESFPFTRYGSIKAHVTRIARDAIPEPDANAIEGDPARATQQSGFAGAQRTQNLVFAVALEPEVTTISADGEKVPLTSGMSVSVEIKTGSRRMLEYVFSPLVEVSARAMKER
jgi:hemolysin D